LTKRAGLVLAVLLLVAAQPAHAGVFFGASVLDTKLDADIAGTSSDFSASDSGEKVYGGFTFGKFFRLEASYLDLGSPDDSVAGIDVKTDITAWDGFAVLAIPLGKRFEVFGKAGYVLWKTKTDLSGAISGSEDDDGTDTAYGVGVALKLGEHLAIRGEYEQFDLENVNSLDVTSIGLDIRL